MRCHFLKYVSLLLILIPVIASGQGKIIAHRGASSIAPENTFSAFNKAIEAGAGFIEIDLRFSKEDSIMVIHDETLDRTTNGKGEVKNYDYNYLKTLSAGYPAKFGNDFTGEKIPTLYEVLKLAKEKVNICIDIKNTPETPVIEMIDKMQMKNSVVLMSYNVEKLKRIKAKAPLIKTVLIKNILSSVDLEVAKNIGAYGVSGGYVTPVSIIKNAHEKGLQCWFGIVNDPGKAERLFEKEIDAVFTDYPQLMTLTKENRVNCFPNPFSKEITIVFDDPGSVRKVKIIDINGSLIKEFGTPIPKSLYWQPGKNTGKGLFFVYIFEGDRVDCKKVLYY